MLLRYYTLAQNVVPQASGAGGGAERRTTTYVRPSSSCLAVACARVAPERVHPLHNEQQHQQQQHYTSTINAYVCCIILHLAGRVMSARVCERCERNRRDCARVFCEYMLRETVCREKCTRTIAIIVVSLCNVQRNAAPMFCHHRRRVGQ